MITKKQRTLTNLILKIIGYSILFVTLLSMVISYASKVYLTNKIADIEGLMVKDINVAWHINSLYLKDVTYQKDSNNISFQEVNFININWFSLIKNKTLHLEEININEGDIHLLSPQKNNQKIDLKSLEYLFKVNLLQIKNTNINTTKNEQSLNIDSLFVDVENLEINQKKITFKKIQYQTSKGVYNNTNSDYDITWDKIVTEQKTTTVVNAKLNPKFSNEEWVKKYTYKKPRTELTIPKLSFNNLDYNSIINKDSLIVKNIILKNALLTTLADENKEPDPKAYKPLLNELLYKVKMPLNIGEIALINNRIDIKVISKKTQQKALIYFNKINAKISDVQNVKKHKINIQLKALVLNKNTINLDMDLWLTPQLFPYTLKGSVSPFEFEQFNTFLLLTKRARIHSGTCTRLDFSIYGDNNKANGEIILDYKNVKIGLFDNDEYIIEKLPTFLVNNFIIKSNNIPNTKDYRTGNMYYKRPQNRSMFHSWWYTLKSGFQSVILPNVVNPKELDH